MPSESLTGSNLGYPTDKALDRLRINSGDFWGYACLLL